jgi:hypothetical protein
VDSNRHLRFGIYPLSAAGTPEGLAIGPPDDYEQIQFHLKRLGAGVVPGSYLVDMEPGGERSVLTLADRYRDAGLLGHVTLGCLRIVASNWGRWLDLVAPLSAVMGPSWVLCRSPTNPTSRSWMAPSPTFSTPQDTGW